MIRFTEDQARWLVEILGQLRNTVFAPGSINADRMQELEVIAAQQLDRPGHFDDLIDSMVKVLMEPRISALNRDYLTILRRAILSPLELAKFNALNNKGIECVNCSRTLSGLEPVAVDGKNVFCYRCAYPESVACQSCEERVPVDGVRKTIERALQRHVCGQQPADVRARSTMVARRGATVTAAGPSPLSSLARAVGRTNQSIRDEVRAQQLGGGTTSGTWGFITNDAIPAMPESTPFEQEDDTSGED